MKAISNFHFWRLFGAATCLLACFYLPLTGCGSSRKATTQPAVVQAKSSEAELADETDMGDAPCRIHYVQPSDTLWSLAERYYGHGKHWRKILAANRNRLSDSTELPVGMKLIIP